MGNKYLWVSIWEGRSFWARKVSKPIFGLLRRVDRGGLMKGQDLLPCIWWNNRNCASFMMVISLKQLKKHWEEDHIPVTSAALSLDPKRMDHEQPESVQFNWDKEIIAQEVLSSEDAASKKKCRIRVVQKSCIQKRKGEQVKFKNCEHIVHSKAKKKRLGYDERQHSPGQRRKRFPAVAVRGSAACVRPKAERTTCCRLISSVAHVIASISALPSWSRQHGSSGGCAGTSTRRSALVQYTFAPMVSVMHLSWFSSLRSSSVAPLQAQCQ